MGQRFTRYPADAAGGSATFELAHET